jgi:hypothetical protein
MPATSGTDDNVMCRSCGKPMKRDVYIAPLGRADGMCVYSCLGCNGTQTRFIPAPTQRANPEGA